jgi:hypothetical protein
MTGRPRPKLLDEHPLVLYPSLAGAYGLLGALLVQQLHYWLTGPGGVDDKANTHWIWKTGEDFAGELGGAVDVSTVRRELQRLVREGVVIATWRSRIDDRVDPRDRTKAYRLDYARFPGAAAPGKGKVQFD